MFKNMDIIGIFIAFTILDAINLTTAIKCFNCAVTEEILTMGNDRIYTPSCSSFNKSSSYIVDCKYSTMCSRIITTMYLQNGFEQKTVTLGCSQQKRSEHVLIGNKWNEKYIVAEIYSEGCETITDNNLVGAIKTYCHCRGDLCNSAQQRLVNPNYLLFGFFIIFIF